MSFYPKLKSCVASGIAILSCCTALIAQKSPEPWPPITQKERDFKDTPLNMGANAALLYFNYFKDDDAKLISVHKRIKILKESGKKYADVEIPLEPGETLKKLQARTVFPDGSVVDFADKPFQKTLYKKRGVGAYVAEVFTFPQAGVGSILDYRYTIALPLHVVQQISVWPMQSDLYTLKEDLRFRPYQGLVEVPTERGRFNAKSQVSYTYLNQSKAATPEKHGDTMELHLEDVLPFVTEAYMPPPGDYQPAILFYYGGRETASPEQFWERWGKILSDNAENFIGNQSAIREKALQVIGSETDPEQKLRKLYSAAQAVRNLSFEQDRNAQELKAEGIKENRTAADVLLHGYGSSTDINRFFIAMARAVGFNAHEIRVSSRVERSFSKLVLALSQLDDDAAEVTVNGNALVLDPGSRYCPYGLIRWQETGVPALRLTSTGAEFITTPDAKKTPMHRTLKAEVAPDGTLRGQLEYKLEGQEALDHRLQALRTDENGRKQLLEAEITSSLPEGSTVRLQESSGWNTAEGPLTARFSLEIPGFASATGKRLLAPSLLFSTIPRDMLDTELRRYPVVFRFPFEEIDETQIRFPKDYTLEVTPYKRRAGLNYAGYETVSSLEGDTLVTRRKLHIDGTTFPAEQFSELKNFFAVVLAGDSGQAVLQHGEPENKQPASN